MEDLIMTYEDEDGSVQLLPGYMFDPTDEIRVDFYLKRRVEIYNKMVFWISFVFADGKIFNERKCFFYNTMGRDLENIDIRVAGSGQWRVMKKGEDVSIPQNNQVIGRRNTLNFWEMQGACARRTRWEMHELCLTSIANQSKLANWAIYCIFKNKDAKKANNARGCNGESSNTSSVEVIDFNVESDSFKNLPQ
ncbi:NAC domain-containing protein 83-like [Lotus japonicus]|uniref:NAC domain-containing protein 83-like n=1 Tax=Lotus japonicus TaxID=34305 RepID=UPI0025849DE8|nr:NAC domain-containing protein 83-like [Lotus japonicus]